MSEKLNILVLHWLRDPKEATDILLKLVFFLKKYKPEHNYIYHDVSLPLPYYVKDIKFDAIIFDALLLCLRYPIHKKYYDFFLKEFSFLKDYDAIKIAFPQDDYDCSEILDKWLVDWKVNYVFSPLADNPEIHMIYKNYSKIGKLFLSYTGYIDDDYFKLKDRNKPFENRFIDICYRAKKLPPYFGWIGELKWRIADIVKEKAKGSDLKLDISYKQEDTILGEKWYEFLGNSKFTLGSLSGSSLIDPIGEIQENVKKYCAEHPDYNYEEIEKKFFPGQDKYNFTAISPRNIEAAFTMTGQVLVEGPYSGILEPWEHYLPLKMDGSNFYEIYQAINDVAFISKMINRCYERIVETKELYYSTLSEKVIGLVMEMKITTERDNKKAEDLIVKYEVEMRKKYDYFFRKRRLIKKISNILKKYPILYNIAKNFYDGFNNLRG